MPDISAPSATPNIRQKRRLTTSRRPSLSNSSRPCSMLLIALSNATAPAEPAPHARAPRHAPGSGLLLSRSWARRCRTANNNVIATTARGVLRTHAETHALRRASLRDGVTGVTDADDQRVVGDGVGGNQPILAVQRAGKPGDALIYRAYMRSNRTEQMSSRSCARPADSERAAFRHCGGWRTHHPRPMQSGNSLNSFRRSS